MKKIAILGASALVAAALIATPVKADVEQNYTNLFSVVEVDVDDVEVNSSANVTKVFIDALNVANAVEGNTPNSLNLGDVDQQVGSAFWLPTNIINDFNIEDLEVDGDLNLSGTAIANRVYLGDSGTYRLALRQVSDANIYQELDEDNFDDIEVDRDLDISLSSINNLFAAGSDATVKHFELVQANYDGWGNLVGQDIIASFACGGSDECEVEVDRNWDVSTFAGVNIATLSSAVKTVNEVEQEAALDRMTLVSVTTITDLDDNGPEKLSLGASAALNVLTVGNEDQLSKLTVRGDIEQDAYGEFDDATEITSGVYDTDLTYTDKVKVSAQFTGNTFAATSGGKVVVPGNTDIEQNYEVGHDDGAFVTKAELDGVEIGTNGFFGIGSHTANKVELSSSVVLNTVSISADKINVRGEIEQNVELDDTHVSLVRVDDSFIRANKVELNSSIVGNLASFEGSKINTVSGNITQNFTHDSASVAAISVTDTDFRTKTLNIGASNFGNISTFK